MGGADTPSALVCREFRTLKGQNHLGTISNAEVRSSFVYPSIPFE